MCPNQSWYSIQYSGKFSFAVTKFWKFRFYQTRKFAVICMQKSNWIQATGKSGGQLYLDTYHYIECSLIYPFNLCAPTWSAILSNSSMQQMPWSARTRAPPSSIISPVKLSFMTAAVKPTPEEPLPVVNLWKNKTTSLKMRKVLIRTSIGQNLHLNCGCCFLLKYFNRSWWTVGNTGI